MITPWRPPVSPLRASLAALFSLGFCAFTEPLFADGPPVDEQGQVTVPHTLIRLDDSQREEMEALNSVTLTKAQWAALRKVSPGTPKRLVGILPARWGDCTCGVLVGGLLVGDQVAVLHEELNSESFAWKFRQRPKLEFQVDSRGQFHLDGTLLRFPVLLEAIEASPALEEALDGLSPRRQYSITVPAGMNERDAVFEDRITRMHDAMKAKGWALTR